MFETNLDQHIKSKYLAEYERETAEGKLIAEKLVNKMVKGELDSLDLEIAIDSISVGRKYVMSHHIRDEFVKHSWILITRQFLSSLRKLTEGKKVLEVCAGCGWTTKLMRDRGCDWIATSLDTGYKCMRKEWVEELDAIDAVEKYKNEIDAIFVSWVPYKSDLDCKLADYNIPMIIVGENMGCTGSEEFWQDYSWEPARKQHPWFRDVDSFEGIHDSTFLVNWR